MPLLTLLVMKVVIEQFLGRNMDHYMTYLFCGNLLFGWFSDVTNHGMLSLYANASIFTKADIPKCLFLFAGSVQTLINFALTLVVFFLFCWLGHVEFTWKFILLVYPITTMMLFNIGIGLVLSVLSIYMLPRHRLPMARILAASYIRVGHFLYDRRFSAGDEAYFCLQPDLSAHSVFPRGVARQYDSIGRDASGVSRYEAFLAGRINK